MSTIPETQQAVQLVGPDLIETTSAKPVDMPGPEQILCRVEAVGLCFSDLKLLKQFSAHGRKGEILSGIDRQALAAIPSYVPGDKPTVPGHEAVVTVVAAGPGVDDYKVGAKYLVQADYRWLNTASSNGAFGYNLEGALQQYVLMDRRVFISPDGESALLPVPEGIADSAIALAEPWACVEDAYRSAERMAIEEKGRMLIVAEAGLDEDDLQRLFAGYGRPAEICWFSPAESPAVGIPAKRIASLEELEGQSFQDIIYAGASADTVEKLFACLAANGLINIVLGGREFEREVLIPVGRIHYGRIRITGTPSSNPSEGMKRIPRTGEVRPGDRLNVVGAGGPMGVMHVIRNVSLGISGLYVFASDMDEHRLAALSRIAAPMAGRNGVEYAFFKPGQEMPCSEFTYTALMVPSPKLAAAAVKESGRGAIINVFAGIPATEYASLDMNRYLSLGIYFIGTSGSTIDDMKSVLEKVVAGRLSTNVSVAAVADLASAAQGIRAVENRLIAGKIIVYPGCDNIGLVELEDMPVKMPEVAALLDGGVWSMAAERKLLELYSR